MVAYVCLELHGASFQGEVIQLEEAVDRAGAEPGSAPGLDRSAVDMGEEGPNGSRGLDGAEGEGARLLLVSAFVISGVGMVTGKYTVYTPVQSRGSCESESESENQNLPRSNPAEHRALTAH